MDEKYISSQLIDDEGTHIVLPLRKKDLGSFISDLLGQQQSIERYVDVKFDINHSWLLNLHETLDQRIKQQAEANLTSFSVVIYFKDGLRRNLSTIEAFKAYNETKKELPVGIKIVWNYLVQFPGRSYPEKQEISFSAQIHSDSGGKYSIKDKFKLESSIFNTIAGESERSTINYNIYHTERTWGDDLEAIISTKLDEVVRGNHIMDSLFNLARLLLALVVLLFCVLYPFFSVSNDMADKIRNISEQYQQTVEGRLSSIDMINEKLNHLSSYMIAIGNKGARDWSISLFVFGPLITLLVLRLTRKGTFSFLVLTKDAERDRELKLLKEKRSYLVIIISYAFAISASIFANYGYAWLTGA